MDQLSNQPGTSSFFVPPDTTAKPTTGSMANSFGLHQIRSESGVESLMATAKKNCPNCNSPLSAKSKNSIITVVNVNTILHQSCMRDWLTRQLESGESWDNRQSAFQSATEYSDLATLINKINDSPAWCNNAQCRATGSLQQLLSLQDPCPSPSSSINIIHATPFANEEDKYHVTACILSQWLNGEFKAAGYGDIETKLGKTKHLIEVKATDPENFTSADTKKRAAYCYSIKAIVTDAAAHEKHFRDLLNLVGADMAVRRLKIEKPNAFEISTDLYITDYSVTNNALTLADYDNKTYVIPFDQVFDVNNRSYCESNLKKLLADKGKDYDDLVCNGLPLWTRTMLEGVTHKL